MVKQASRLVQEVTRLVLLTQLEQLVAALVRAGAGRPAIRKAVAKGLKRGEDDGD